MQNLLTVEGLVIPADWDEDDRVTLVSLLTDDEGEYLVVADRAGRELSKHIHQRVRTAGRVYRDDFGEQVLRVESFTVLRH